MLDSFYAAADGIIQTCQSLTHDCMLVIWGHSLLPFRKAIPPFFWASDLKYKTKKIVYHQIELNLNTTCTFYFLINTVIFHKYSMQIRIFKGIL